MGKLKENMLQSLRFDRETKTWLTKNWELKKSPRFRASAEEARTKLTDGDGLILYLTSAGSMIWRVEYRWQKARKTYTIGAYTDDELGVSLMEAREALVQVKRWLKEGKDPSEEKRAKNKPAEEEVTFATIAREWFEHAAKKLAPAYKKRQAEKLDGKLIPAIGDIPIAQLEGRHIMPLLRETEARGHYETAHKIARLASQVCDYAVALGYCKYNAAARLTKMLLTRPTTHRAAITDPVEIGRILRAIDAYEGSISVSYALKILPYVFLRNSELRCAAWSEIDLENALWTIPGPRMKMRRAHLVPLAKQVVKLFRVLKKRARGELVFPSPRTLTKPISDASMLNALRNMGYEKTVVCPHGFRGTASTRLNELGYRSDIIEAQLAHVQENKIRAAYNHAEYLDERRKMMQEWADYLDSLKSSA